MSTRFIFLLSLTALLLFSQLSVSKLQNAAAEDDDEDLSFLEEETDAVPHDHNHGNSHDHYPDPDQFDEELDNDDDVENYSDLDDSELDSYKEPEIDDKDVVVLKEGNFSDFVTKNKFVMVEFYAPWCGHCQSLAPEYAAAATELKAEEVVLAKVDATEENELAQEYDIQGFPTVYFFVDGVHKPYPGPRTKDGIVTWIKKKTGPGIYNLTKVDDAERLLTSETKLVLGFLNSLVGPESEELAAASRLEDEVNFYQTVNPDVAKLFHLDPQVKRPALVMLKKEAEKLSVFDGNFSKSEITEFVFANKLPLVTIFTRESAPLIFESTIKKQLLLFAISNDSEKVLPIFQEAAKLFKGKLIFVYVEMDNEDVGKPVSEYFGISGTAPKVLAYTGNDDAKKFVLDGDVTLDKIKNDGDVKIVVGNNFDEIVLDESKDVLLELYAPWCGHCQALEPTYNKLARHLRGIESIVIAKMDGTTNEHPRAKSDGFPTLLFFPAGNKSFDPITVDTDRTVVAFYKFLKKHASIPFKLVKPAAASASKAESSDAKDGIESSAGDAKDEL
ncbi:protein disulfide isomerase [Salix suchowensis]|nr:protein disulfide isomerase [Salix suchowensis]